MGTCGRRRRRRRRDAFEATSSNYDLVSQMGGASITSPGAESGQTALPLFANLAGGDVNQAAGSPSIDAGSSEVFGFSGTLDVDRDPRTVGSAPDIGGDELVPPSSSRTRSRPTPA